MTEARIPEGPERIPFFVQMWPLLLEIGPVFFAFGWHSQTSGNLANGDHDSWYWHFYGLITFYYVVCFALPLNASVGMILFGHQVTDKNGEKAPLPNLIGRGLLTPLAFSLWLPVLLSAAFHPEKRTVLGLLSGTRVVRRS